MQSNPSNTDKRRWLEIIAVAVTALGKFIFMDWLDQKLIFILVAIFGWTSYVIIRSRQDTGILKSWGFRKDNFKKSLKIVLPFGLVTVITCILIGYFLDTINITWHMLPILVLYPIWGTIQQFLVIAIVGGNLQDMEKKPMNETLIIFIAALLFGAIHYPFYWLVAATFLLALFYGYVYLKVRNLFVLGIFHGWLGAIFFYTVVGRDPFMEVFGKFF